MTFKEKLEIEHPEEISEEYDSGCFGCPHDYGYESISESVVNCDVYGEKGCVYCWNREMEPTKLKAKLKKEFNWEEFKDVNNKIAVHCKIEEEAKDFCKQMHVHGMAWCDGVSYLDDTHFNINKKETAYSANGCFCYVNHYKLKGYKILEWSDYMTIENGNEQGKQGFTKADLRDGMVVEWRIGDRFFLLCDRFITYDGFEKLAGYDNDLNHVNCNKDYDIVKVFVVKLDSVTSLKNLFDDENLELIWEQKETKRMTPEEMRKKLEELTGEKIEIKLSVDDKRVALANYCNNREGCGSCPFNSNTSKCFGMQDIFAFEDEDVENLYNKLKQNI